MLNFSKKANETINEYLSMWDTNKLAIGVVFPNGERDFYVSKGAQLNTPFDIGSISKTFTAALILKLVSEGKISLDAYVDEYIDLPKGRYPKISQLLTHTAGCRYLTPIEITLPTLLKKSYQKANPYRHASEKTVIKCLSRRRHCKENYHYSYSDFPYAVLAIVASRVTGEPFPNLLENMIENDFGFLKTQIARRNNREISYYKGHEIPSWDWELSNPYISGGGIVSNIVDMTEYASLQLKEELSYVRLSHKLWENSFQKHSNVGTCLGWHTYKKSNQLWHVGGVGTYRSSVIFNVKRRIAIVVLGNSKGKKSANVHYLAKLLYSDIQRKKLSFD